MNSGRVKLWCATTNAGKLREFRLAGAYAEALPDLHRIEPPAENGVTFEENAAAKAIYYSRFAGDLLFADDSGLEVDALDGEPGVHSARFAGPYATGDQNNALLLARIAGEQDRGARFVCVIALAREGKLLQTFRGEVEGRIVDNARGAGGFGYDPLFFYPPLQRTLAEISESDKFQVSHRGKAFRAMVGWLQSNIKQT